MIPLSTRYVAVVSSAWQLPDWNGIDTATLGASRLIGQGLIELIGRDSCGLG